MANMYFTVVPAKALKDGTNKVRLYVSHHSKVKYVPTSICIRNDQWRNGKVVNHPHAAKINLKLTQLMGKYLDALYSIDNPDSFSCDQIVDILTGNVIDKHITVSMARDKFLEVYIKSNRGKSAYLYELTINGFISLFGDIEIASITQKTIEKFHKHMVNDLHYNDTTQNIKLTEFRTFIKFCIDNELVSYQIKPFAGFKFPKIKRRDAQITLSQLKTIKNLKSGSKTLCAMRDMFMLSFYLGGMNLVDMFRLDLSKDHITFRRQKVMNRTDHLTSIPIVPQARDIIRRNSLPDGTLCFGKYDSYLKARCAWGNNYHVLGDAAGVTTRFLYYSARKTFVQLGVKCLIPFNVLEYCTGETPKNHNPIAAYYVIDKDVAEEAMKKIFALLED